MLFLFTHDMLMDWILPGVPPTHKHVEVPLVVICDIRGDKLYYEHIYWDQASVLVQIGLLKPDEFEPYVASYNDFVVPVYRIISRGEDREGV